MAKKKVKHYKSEAVFRGDSLDLSPNKTYDQITWKMESDHQNYAKLNNQYRHNAISRRIVAKPAEDATRNGWRLVIPDDPTKQEIYQKAMDKLKLAEVLSKQIIYQRLHGDGYITFGVKEFHATDTSEPLDPENIQNLVFVHAFGQNHIDSYRTNDDPTNINYGKEQAIVLRPQESGTKVDKNGEPIYEPPESDPIVIDKSRYFHVSLDKFEDDETGLSILKRCEAQLNALSIALETTGKMLREYVFKVFRSQKLMDMTPEEFDIAKAKISRVINSEAMSFIGPQDSIEKIGTPTSGVNTLYDFVWQNLAAASNIPKSVLTGEQSGTLAGASQDVANYYDSVKAIQEQLLKPEIEYIVKLLMYSQDVGDGSEDPTSFEWHIEFNPLWSADDKTQSETLLNHANAANTLVSSGILDIDEAKQLFNGQGNNNVQGMQNTNSMQTDSAADLSNAESNYKKDLKKAKHAKKSFTKRLSDAFRNMV